MIVAEIGQNWCADRLLGFKLIDEAKSCGADLVKFQLYDSKKLYGEYQPTELTKEMARIFFQYGELQGIEVFFSVFDVERVKWCEEMGVKRYKIAHSQGENTLLAQAVLATQKEIFVSVTHVNKLRDWYNWLSRQPKQVRPLYCIAEYPTSLDKLQFFDVSLEAPDPLKSTFRAFYGFSDHTIGLDVAKIALARGAEIIEKHFAIDHKTGIDAEWSMNPNELKELKRWEQVCSEVL